MNLQNKFIIVEEKLFFETGVFCILKS